MNTIVETRPAQPELLTPVPFINSFPTAQQLSSRNRWLTGLLLALALFQLLPYNFAEYFGDSPFMVFTYQLLAAAAVPLLLVACWESHRQAVGIGRCRVRGVDLLLWQSPLAPIGTGLSALILLLPLAGALIYESCYDRLLHPKALRSFAVWDFSIALALLVLLATILADLYRSWRQQRLNHGATDPAAHEIPARGPARRAASFFTDSPPALALRTAVLLSMSLLTREELLSRNGFSGSYLWLLFVMLALTDFFYTYWRRWGYRPGDDCFYVEEWRGFKWVERQRWPAADYLGFYVLWLLGPDKRYAQLWLAGPAGGRDVAIATFKHCQRINGKTAQRLAVQLSRVSGLLVLYRLKDTE